MDAALADSREQRVDGARVSLSRCQWRREGQRNCDSGRDRRATSEVDLAFVCHTDTVPFVPEAWPRRDVARQSASGFLHGCGACDVKGSLAGILAAIAQTPVEKITGPVALVLTADEEIGCVGATHLLSAPVLRAKSVIVCEPTSLRPADCGQRIRTGGGCGAGQGGAQRPAERRRVRHLCRGEDDAGRRSARQARQRSRNDLFDPPSTTFNVGVVQGGTAKNIVPGAVPFSRGVAAAAG